MVHLPEKVLDTPSSSAPTDREIRPAKHAAQDFWKLIHGLRLPKGDSNPRPIPSTTTKDYARGVGNDLAKKLLSTTAGTFRSRLRRFVSAHTTTVDRDFCQSEPESRQEMIRICKLAFYRERFKQYCEPLIVLGREMGDSYGRDFDAEAFCNARERLRELAQDRIKEFRELFPELDSSPKSDVFQTATGRALLSVIKRAQGEQVDERIALGRGFVQTKSSA